MIYLLVILAIVLVLRGCNIAQLIDETDNNACKLYVIKRAINYYVGAGLAFGAFLLFAA